MKSFSTAAFVAALALVVPSASAANYILQSSSYDTADCTGDASSTTFTDFMVAYDTTESLAAATCATVASATCSGMSKSTCVASISVGSSGLAQYDYLATDTKCSSPLTVTVYSDVCGLSCGTTLTIDSCSGDDCSGTCTASEFTPKTACTANTCGDDDDTCTSGEATGYTKYECLASDDVCFSGDDTLTLESGAAKRLSEVAVGDKVQTADANGVLSFSEVVALPHAANNKLASFVNVATASGKSVKATKMHLLQQCDGSLAYAGSLAAGDCLRTVDGDEAVAAVSMTTAEGIYTAVTNNEFLVVNGIVASPFAVTHGLTNAYYNVHRFVAKVFPSALKSPLVLAANAFLGGAFLTSGGSK